MEFLKKHYEKILLGFVLAGLVGALVFLPFYIATDKQRTNDTIDTIFNSPSVKELTNLDLTASSSVSSRLKTSYNLDLETTNRVFNPMNWQKTLDNTMIPVANHIGPQMVIVTNTTPLYLIITLDSVATNNVELGSRYVIGVEKQAEKNPAKRRKQPHYVSIGDKANDTFALVEVKGVPENPDALVVKLVDTGEMVTVSHEKPFRRVDAYSADFRYDPEKKVFRGRRIGDKLSFNGIDYTVDDVKQNELILRDQTNQKKTSLPFTP